MHLLYARFWYKVMHDAGLGVPGVEPFIKYRSQGQLLAPDGRRMSKSRGNVITPDEMVGRVWDVVTRTHAEAAGERFPASDDALARLRHKTVKRVTQDIEQFRFNTMVAALMEFANALGERYRAGTWRTAAFQDGVETLTLLLAPSAPFIAEGLWQTTGGFGRAPGGSPFVGSSAEPFGPAGSVHQQAWPSWDEALTRDEVVTVVVQVNGRVRDRVELPADAAEDAAREAALARPRIQEFVADSEQAKFIYVKGRLLNIVTS
jgi:leucyl-tRNA synthetase